jgi:hypothetical protein
MTIKYHYQWSENYKMFRDILKFSLQLYPDVFEISDEFIPQEKWTPILDSSIEKGLHPIAGCWFKVYKIHELLHTLPENSYFIFSDVDVIIFPDKKLKELMDLYVKIEADMIFMKEAQNNDCSNFGFSMYRVCEINRKLFDRMIDKIKIDPTSLDMTILNQCLKDYNGSHFYFPPELVMTSCSAIDCQQKSYNSSTMFGKVMIYQAICDPTKGKESMIYQKIHQYKMFGIPFEHIRRVMNNDEPYTLDGKPFIVN